MNISNNEDSSSRVVQTSTVPIVTVTGNQLAAADITAEQQILQAGPEFIHDPESSDQLFPSSSLGKAQHSAMELCEQAKQIFRLFSEIDNTSEADQARLKSFYDQGRSFDIEEHPLSNPEVLLHSEAEMLMSVLFPLTSEEAASMDEFPQQLTFDLLFADRDHSAPTTTGVEVGSSSSTVLSPETNPSSIPAAAAVESSPLPPKI